MSNLKKDLAKGSLANFISKYSNILLQLVFSAILSRLLTPDDFGIIAVITIIINFFNMISEVGIGTGIIQNDLEDDELGSIFLATFGIGLLTSSVFFLLNNAISVFYANDIYRQLIKLLSLVILLKSLSIVPVALLRKRKKFITLAIIDVSSFLVSSIVAIILAFKGFGVYALVLRSIVQSVLSFLLYFIFGKVPFSREINMSGMKRIFSYSFFQFLFYFFNFFTRNLDSLLIGKFLGQSTLGFYEKSYKLMLLPVQNITNVISPVLHPVMAQIKDYPRKIYINYMKIVHLLALIGFPASVFLHFTAEELLIIWFGDQWYQSIPIFQILAFSVGIQVVQSSSGAIYQAIGKTKGLFISGICSFSITISAIFIGLQFGVKGVATGVVIAFWSFFFPNYFYLIKVLMKQNYRTFLKQLVIPWIISFVLGIVLYFFSFITIQSLILSLITKIALSAAIYFSLIFLLKENRIIKDMIR